MHFATKFVAVVAAMAAGVTAQLTVASPAALIQCQPVQLSWSGSTAGGPYFVSIIPGGQPSASPLEDFGEVANSPYSWTVNIAAGTSVTVKVTDQSGETQYSDQKTIQDSSSTSCLTSGGSSASGAASGASESAASATGSMASMSGSMSASGSMSGSANPTGSAAAATSSPNSGSSVVVGSLTGLAGLVVAALGVVA